MRTPEVPSALDPISAQATALYDLLPTGICVVDDEGRVLAANTIYCDMLGYPREELIGTPVARITSADDIGRDDRMRHDLLHGALREYRVEKRYRHKQGHTIWVRVDARRGGVLPDGRPYAVGTINPIEDLKQTERELDLTRAHVNAVFEQSTIGVAETDLSGRLLAVNDRYCELMQRPREELIGVRMDQFTHPEDLEANLPLFERLVPGDQLAMDKRYVRPDGSHIWAKVAICPIRGSRGEPTQALLACLFEITARKRLEENLREADRRKDEFLAMLAHELRNPLAPIAAAAGLLKDPGLPADKLARISDVLARQARHMAGLLDDLLDVSRVTRGLVELDRSPVDLRTTVAEAIEQVRPLMEARRHAFELQVGPRAPVVTGDAKRLVQVVANLLSNAAKYTPPPGRILLSLQVDGRDAIIRVADNGIGMTPELAAQAFELFTQGKRPVDRSQGGLGIGLPLVRKLVELHGGQVRADSPGEGQGCEFTVVLPLAMQAHAAGTPAEGDALGHAARRPLRALVVDDNADAAAMLGLLLESLGHQVTVANDGDAALVAAREQRPDVCLLDIGMPGMDGNTLAARLRRMPETAEAVLIAVTGYGQEQDRREAAAAGFDHHFVKPIAMEPLIDVLSSLPAVQARLEI
ncbi:PAS domain S-box protein [Ramlibacter sp. AW1]|uniref:histidine kinase n=1 Tax=Ramlibacter aurantiacus TaxID=2801330 RepID=A0A936ZPI9_9BURK|nr:PAS domain S-box protein [Ramlibacter aurantiacus]MBL0420086.1 PAS domain S-box protein [Ramlibacter aurantiacus]